MSEQAEKRYRQVKVNIPEHIAWRIDKRIGGNSLNALVKLFLIQFATGKAGLHIEFEPTAEDLEKVKR